MVLDRQRLDAVGPRAGPARPGARGHPLRRLRARGKIAYRATPYGNAAVPFNFDWSFDFYPLAYQRPGQVTTIYRLDRGACAG